MKNKKNHFYPLVITLIFIMLLFATIVPATAVSSALLSDIHYDILGDTVVNSVAHTFAIPPIR